MHAMGGKKETTHLHTFHAPFQLNVSPTWFCVFVRVTVCEVHSRILVVFTRRDPTRQSVCVASTPTQHQQTETINLPLSSFSFHVPLQHNVSSTFPRLASTLCGFARTYSRSWAGWPRSCSTKWALLPCPWVWGADLDGGTTCSRATTCYAAGCVDACL